MGTEVIEAVNQYKTELANLGENLRNRGQTITVEIKQKVEDVQQKSQGIVAEKKAEVEIVQKEVEGHVKDMSPIAEPEHQMLARYYIWTSLCTSALMIGVIVGSALSFLPLMVVNSKLMIYVLNLVVLPTYLILYQAKTEMGEMERRHFNMGAALILGLSLGVQLNNSYLGFWMPLLNIPPLVIGLSAGVLKLPDRKAMIGAAAGICVGTYIVLGIATGLPMGYLFWVTLVICYSAAELQIRIGRLRQGKGQGTEQLCTVVGYAILYNLVHLLCGRSAEAHREAMEAERGQQKAAAVDKK